MQRIIKTILSIFAIIILLIVGTIFYVKAQLVPRAYEDGTTFTIEQGTYGKTVFSNLEEQGIIRNKDIAYFYFKFLSPTVMDFKAGTFELEKGMDIDQIIETLSDDSKFYRPTVTVTITEGDFAIDMAKELAAQLDVTADEILDYWDNEQVVREYMEEYPFLTEQIFTDGVKYYLEGYLFPSTYELYQNSTLDEITRKFLDQTLVIYNKYKDDFDNAPSYYHYETDSVSQATIHDIFTMASIIEWESGYADEAQDIASAIYNRLNYKPIDMIRSSVTACYSQDLGKDNCILVDQDLNLAYKEDGETYNTYTKYGLPVGAIGNPSEASIYGALHPSDTDYFYWVGDLCGIDGKTHFATVKEGNDKISAKYIRCE